LKKIAIILLAAGGSSRMGRSKQLLQIDGKSLLSRAISTFSELSELKKVVVLGANANEHVQIVRSFVGCECIVNEHWKNGIGSSIKAGLKYVVESAPETDAVLYVVCDQPWLTGSHIQKIIHEYQNQEGGIIASVYQNTEGVPALFDRKYFREIERLNDSQGAKKIIELHSGAKKKLLEFPEGEFDLDTPEDVEKFIRAQKSDK
jgi:molybdenum cofactor cytidylyltransferase